MSKSNKPSNSDRIERFLHAASSFEPEEAMPDSISSRLLTKDQTRNAGWFVVSWRLIPALAMAGAWGIFVMLNRPTHPRSSSTVKIARQDFDLRERPTIAPSPRAPKEGIRNAFERRPVQGTARSSASKRSDRRPKDDSNNAHKRPRRQQPLVKSPKVKWQVARFQRVQTGVVAAGWVAQPEGEEGVRISPALVEIPLAAAEMSAPMAPGDDHHSKQASYEEIH